MLPWSPPLFADWSLAFFFNGLYLILQSLLLTFARKAFLLFWHSNRQKGSRQQIYDALSSSFTS
jgi:hypothetical protein